MKDFAEVQSGPSSPVGQGESGEVGSADGLPAGWAFGSIEDTTTKVGSGATPKGGKAAYKESGTPLIRSMNVHFDEFRRDGLAFIDDEQAAGLNGAIVNSNDVLLNITGASIGRVSYVPDDLDGGRVNQHVCIIRLDENLSQTYLRYYLSSPKVQDKIAGEEYGVTRPALTKGQVLAFQIPWAPKAEQIRIVSAIESLQERSARAKQALCEVGPLLSQLRQSVLRGAFSGRLTERWRTENPNVEPASELLARIRTERRERWEAAQLAKYEAKGKQPPKNWQERYKEPEPVDAELLETLPELPESWEWITWESILSLDEGAFKRGPFGSTLKKSIFVSEGYKVYEQYCPINDDCSYVRYYITPEKFEEIKAFAVQAKDFLISCSGVSLGRITQVPEEFEEGVINQALLRVRLNSAAMADLYFKWLFRSPFFQEQIFANAGGSAIPNVKGVRDLKAIPVPLPPLEEQQEIVEQALKALSSVNAVETVLVSSEAELTQLDQSILAKAFRGELVPQDPSDEPASQLLHRIRTTRAQLEAEKKAKKKTGKIKRARKSK